MARLGMRTVVGLAALGLGCASPPAAKVGPSAASPAPAAPAREAPRQARLEAIPQRAPARVRLELEWPAVTPRAVPPGAVRRVQPRAAAAVRADARGLPASLPPCDAKVQRAERGPCLGVADPSPGGATPRGDSGAVLLRVRSPDPYAAPTFERRPPTRLGPGCPQPPTR
jgi:hypothetical protein